MTSSSPSLVIATQNHREIMRSSVSGLDSFQPWAKAVEEVKPLRQFGVDLLSHESLQTQIDLLEAVNQEEEARAILMREVAEQDDWPLPRQLGLLAGLRMIERIKDGGDIDACARIDPIFVGAGIELALQETQRKLESEKPPIPVLMSVDSQDWKFPGMDILKRKPDKVATGEVLDPSEAFSMERPTIDDNGVVEFYVPTQLRHVTGVTVQGKFYTRFEPRRTSFYEDGDRTVAHPSIPELARHLDRNLNIDQLVIGKKAVREALGKAMMEESHLLDQQAEVRKSRKQRNKRRIK